MIKKFLSFLVIMVCLAGVVSGQAFTFSCYGGYLTGADCQICTGQTTARLFNGLIIRRGTDVYKLIDCPYIVRVQGNNLIFQELGYPNPETVTISLLSSGYSTLSGFKDSTACMCARQDSSWIGGSGGDPSITNEGILGVSGGGSNDALLTSNTSTANGVTYSGSNTVIVSESTSANGGTITFQADTSLLATVNDLNARQIVDTVNDFTALRAYAATAPIVFVRKTGIEGFFKRVTGSWADDGGITIVGTFKWRRIAEDLHIVNVKWFGAVGDSITDDNTAIQAALSFCKDTSDATLYFPFGRYRYTATINYYKPVRFSIRGDGMHNTYLFPVNVTGIYIRTDSSTTLYYGEYGPREGRDLMLKDFTMIRVGSNTFSDKLYGIDLRGGFFKRIENIAVKNFFASSGGGIGSVGIRLWQPFGTDAVQHTIFDNVYVAACDTGIVSRLQNTMRWRSVKIDACKKVGLCLSNSLYWDGGLCQGNENCGIYLKNSNPSVLNEVTIVGVHFESNAYVAPKWGAIYKPDNTDMSDLNIHDCLLSSPGGTHILRLKRVQHSAILNNRYSGNATTDTISLTSVYDMYFGNDNYTSLKLVTSDCYVNWMGGSTAAVASEVGQTIGTAGPGANYISTGGGISVGSSYYTVTAPTNGAIIQGNTGIGNSSPTQPLHVTGNARVTGAYYDSNNDPGTSGQILSSTVTGTDWVTNSGDNWGTQVVQRDSSLTGTGVVCSPLGIKGYSAASNGQVPSKATGGITWITPLTAEVDGSITNEGILGVGAGGANDALLTSNTSTANGVTFSGAGIVTVSESTSTNGGTITITGTEVDGSTTNELQTIANTSDATSHTATLSSSGGSVKFVEGSNITLTTTGTSLDGIVTIAATAAASAADSTWAKTAGGYANKRITDPIYRSSSARINMAADSAALTLKMHSTFTNPVFKIQYNNGTTAAIAHVYNSSNPSLIFGSVPSVNSGSANNTVFGITAPTFTSGAGQNSFFGKSAGNACNGCYENTFIGSSAGVSIVAGFQNTFIGYLAGQNTTSGYQNMFLGRRAGLTNVSGQNNVYLGSDAGRLGTGSGNVAIGGQAGDQNTGSTSVFVGFGAGRTNTGSGNVFIGASSGELTSGSNYLNIDNGNTSSPLIGGDFSTNKVGINTAHASIARDLTVTGEVRITDLTTDTPTKIVGADSDGDLTAVTPTDEIALGATTLGTNFSTTISPSQITAQQNNWNPTNLSTAWVIRVDGDAAFEIISGITAPTFNKRLALWNVGGNAVLLPTENQSSSAANRFAFGRDVILFPGKTVEIMYDITSSRWRLMSQGGLYDNVQNVYFNEQFNAPVSGTSGEWPFFDIVSAGTIGATAPVAGRWSGISVNTGSSASGNGYIASKDVYFYNNNSSGTATWAYAKAVLKTPSSLSDGSNDYTIRFGFNSSTGGGGVTDGMYIDYNHSIHSGDWSCATTNAGTTQRNDSGVTVAVSTVYTLEVVFRTNLSVEFFVNGTRVATNDSFIPTGEPMELICEIEKSIGTAQRDISVYTLQTSIALVK